MINEYNEQVEKSSRKARRAAQAGELEKLFPRDPTPFVQVVSLESSTDSLGARKKQGGVVGERLMRLLESVDVILVQSNMPELKDRRRAVAR